MVRWQEAQLYEAAYWAREAATPEKLRADLESGWRFTMGLLDIRPDTVADCSVLDLAGGDFPLALAIKTASYTVVDPAEPQRRIHGVGRIQCMAEDYHGELVDEVWGYNVLQHVLDPDAVMATARRCASKTIRWFDVVDTPIYPVHPHSIHADWLRGQFEGFRIVRDIEGSRLVDGYRQKFVSLVAERLT